MIIETFHGKDLTLSFLMIFFLNVHGASFGIPVMGPVLYFVLTNL